MRKVLIGAAALASALVATAGATAGGKPLFAAPNGSGSACTANAPCSLQTAVATTPAGSTVHALPGVYHGGVVTAASRLQATRRVRSTGT